MRGASAEGPSAATAPAPPAMAPLSEPSAAPASARVSGHTSGGAGPRAGSPPAPASPPAPTSHGAWRLEPACCPQSDLTSCALGMGVLFQPRLHLLSTPTPHPSASRASPLLWHVSVSLLFVTRFPVLTPGGPGPAFFPCVTHLVPINLSLLCWLPSNFSISACS